VISPLAVRWTSLVGGEVVWRCCVCETHNEAREFCGKCCPVLVRPEGLKRQLFLFEEMGGEEYRRF
jgi:hypothetical protein